MVKWSVRQTHNAFRKGQVRAPFNHHFDLFDIAQFMLVYTSYVVISRWNAILVFTPVLPIRESKPKHFQSFSSQPNEAKNN